jgi:hypothetical protein
LDYFRDIIYGKIVRPGFSSIGAGFDIGVWDRQSNNRLKEKKFRKSKSKILIVTS